MYKTSEGERAFETHLNAFKLPVFHKEHAFCEKRKWRFDFAWPDKKVAVEIDGGQWTQNGGRHNRDSDRVKMNEAVASGWRVLRFSTQQIRQNPYGCIVILGRTLEGV